MRISLLGCILFSFAIAGAQTTPDFSWAKGNNYRSATNPLYWKNKKPYEGYWQQDVYYRISAVLDDNSETIEGIEYLTYYNNSPNTLTELYFHLYQNAVQPGSLVDELYTNNKTAHTFGPNEKQKKGTTIDLCYVGGNPAVVNIDYTVMNVGLQTPLASGDSIQVEIHFTTYFDRGSIRRRMKVYDHDGFKHFNGVHWYPRICVYDRKFAWETSQHMEHEFYGDYGSFDVSLTMPNEYVNEATGVLLNPEEAYPGDLRARLDIGNFKERLPNDQPKLVAPKNGKMKTWKYHADNVHDFAWTADPTYRIGEVEWRGIHCIALAQEQNAWRWQPSAGFVANVVATYSQDFGMYEYPKMVAADAADGMEYPMLTLDGGIYPSHRGLIAHEVGHNWFFGMIGSNETYRAALDEGFTQFLTAWSMKKLTGQNQRPSDIEYNTDYFGYLRDAIDGTDPTLNTHSDDFHNAIGHGGGYGHVYYKTATMLYNLEYVLGDSVFKSAMQHYVQQWKICHPYMEDFRNSIIMSTGTDLNWFFDQWFETTKHVDYSIKKVKRKEPDTYTITIKRKGDMIMPVDLRIAMKDGNNMDVTIPVSDYRKPGVIAPQKNWTGWGTLRPEYELTLKLPSAIKQVQIDPSGRLADIDQRNNVWKRKYSLQFDKENDMPRDNRGGYKFFWRPDAWYSYVDGFRAGVKLSGNYAARKHIFDLYVWGQTGQNQITTQQSGHVIYRFDYRNFFRKNGEIVAGSRNMSSLWIHYAGWEKNLQRGRIYTQLKYMQRRFSSTGMDYVPLPGGSALAAAYLPDQPYWSRGSNISANVGYMLPYTSYKNSGSWRIDFRSTTPWSDASYSYATFTWLNQMKLGKTVLRSRLYARTGTGGQSPAESMIYVSGASPEEMQENRYARDLSMLPLGNDALNRSLHLGGGMNLRGFAGYTLPHQSGDSIKTFYRGNNAAAVNAEWDFTGIFSFLPHAKMLGFNVYAFGDAGILAFPNSGKWVQSGVLGDAGLGLVLNIRNWNAWAPKKSQPAMTALKPLSIRLDMPFFVSAVPAGQENLAFRWMLGINRAF